MNTWTRRVRLSLSAVILVSCAAGCGDDPVIQSGSVGTNGRIGSILLRNVYLEAPQGGRYTSGEAGRLRLWLFSEDTYQDRLLTVRSASADQAVIRWDRHCDGRFEAVEHLPVPVDKAPVPSSAYFVELVGFHGPVLAGTTIPVTFTFEKAGQCRVDAMVEAAGGGDSSTAPSCASRS